MTVLDKAGLALVLSVAACSSSRTGTVGTSHDLAGSSSTDSGGGGASDFAVLPGDAGPTTTYTVYAHSNTILYSIDLAAKTLVEVGPFSTGSNGDTMTDLAVAPDNTIYVVSKTTLYTASPTDGHVTAVGKITACGSDNVALTTTPDGNLYAGDHQGAFCKIDLTTAPPTVTQIGMLGSNLALSGDIVGVGDGTIYGTADTIGGSSTNDTLVTIDATTGAVIKNIGKTGYPQLYGIAYAEGQVFGFTHDGSGDVITINPATGVGTLFNTFKDSGGKAISFAGAGVNSMVAPVIN